MSACTLSSIRALAAAGRANGATEDLVELITVGGKEYLFFKPFHVDVALLRGTTADEDGNITMEHEAVFGEMISMAQAARRAGGIVIVQVKRMALRGTLPPKQVKIPGMLVDLIVVDPGQTPDLLYHARSGLCRRNARCRSATSQRCRFRCARSWRGARRWNCFPAPSAISAPASRPASRSLAAEEDALDDVVLTNEQGLIGGAPATGNEPGAGRNYQAMVDQPYQFDFYDGGGLDLAFLSFAEVDEALQRQCQPLRRQDHRRRRLHQYQPERQDHGLQRHVHRRRPRHRLARRTDA